MMLADGFIILSRRHQSHPFWLGEKFSKGQAIVDLYYLAAFTPHEISINGHVLFLDVGDVAGATRFLADRWRWSLHKTASFLNRLESDKILEKKRNGKGNGSPSIYHIIDYGTYRKTESPKGNGYRYDQETVGRRSGDKTKEGEKGEKGKTFSAIADVDFLSSFSPENQNHIRQAIAAVGTTKESGQLTQSQINKLIGQFSKFPSRDVLTACQIYIDQNPACTGKAENYLLGIMRRISKNRESSASQTSSQTIKTEGQSAIDRAMAMLKKETNNVIPE